MDGEGAFTGVPNYEESSPFLPIGGGIGRVGEMLHASETMERPRSRRALQHCDRSRRSRSTGRGEGEDGVHGHDQRAGAEDLGSDDAAVENAGHLVAHNVSSRVRSRFPLSTSESELPLGNGANCVGLTLLSYSMTELQEGSLRLVRRFRGHHGAICSSEHIQFPSSFSPSGLVLGTKDAESLGYSGSAATERTNRVRRGPDLAQIRTQPQIGVKVGLDLQGSLRVRARLCAKRLDPSGTNTRGDAGPLLRSALEDMGGGGTMRCIDEAGRPMTGPFENLRPIQPPR
ncbi:hypothetical protein BDK51DRAFT_25747 [Blyttiomyces helicus]|uniref:Uncharacterized protein n=1 Tax=Blyttiomyces helicus TaxID=388810 RepID=A0A4P9WEF6_9FUNG|nr:hypothetical protein BDK51DRAFT_25747 [Blyttiomyces helicus]|eukprot:RKO90974.1 hypothetical protein BDK51DRAFT_25747 [Blyttiomyces helicus]